MDKTRPLRLIDLREVMERTGLKRDSIYRLGRLQKMPRPVKVGAWASRWVASEVDEYVAACIAERDRSAAAERLASTTAGT